VPKEARRSHLQANAKQPSIGKLIDEAMAAIEASRSLARSSGRVGLVIRFLSIRPQLCSTLSSDLISR